MTSNERHVVVVTGATGFVGGHFVHRFLRRRGGAHGSIVAVVRGANVASARARLLRALEAVAASYAEEPLGAREIDRIEVVLGDVTQNACGLSADVLGELRGRVDAFWHFAASLAYEESAEAELTRQNVGGVANAIACARGLAVSRFFYVSTAYTAGRRIGLVPEELHPENTPFNNLYEQTKAEAERTVVRELAGTGIDVWILRPSIVIGPSVTCDLGGSGTGIYGFIRELRRARRALNFGRAHHVVAGDPNVVLNLIPVDHVVDSMLSVHDDARHLGRVLHLTNPHGPRLGDAMALGCELAGVRPIHLVPGHVPATAIERKLGERFEFYSYYFRDSKIFARSLPCDWSLTSMASLRPYVERALGLGEDLRVARVAS